jgi:hypothetical protein
VGIGPVIFVHILDHIDSKAPICWVTQVGGIPKCTAKRLHEIIFESFHTILSSIDTHL